MLNSAQLPESIPIHAIWTAFNHLTPYNGVRTLHIIGQLPPEIVRLAVDMLQNQQPILQYHLVHQQAESGFFLSRQNTASIPIQLHHLANVEEYLAVLETYLYKRFDNELSPPIAIGYVQIATEPESIRLILAAHHGIVDGASYTLFAKTLLEFCDQIQQNNPPTSQPFPFLSPNTALALPTALRGWKGKFAFLRLIWQQVQLEKRYKPQPLALVPPPLNAVPQTGILHRRLSAEYLQRVLQLTKQHKTTLHGWVCAALYKAAFDWKTQHQSQDGIAFKCFSPVNLRPFMQPPAPPEILGCHVSAVGTVAAVTAQTQIGKLAQQIRSDVQANIENNSMILARLYGGVLAKAAAKKQQFNPIAFSVSNLGKLPFESKFAQFYIVDCANYVTNTAGIHPNIALIFNTFEQRLFFDFTYAKQLFTLSEVNDIADKFIGYLCSFDK